MRDIAQGQQVSKKLPAKQLIPYVLLVVGAVAMAVSFFLPFASAKGDYAEYLKQYGDRVYTAEAGLHNKDVVGLSLLTFLRIYIAGLQSGKLLGGMYLEAVICITLMAVIAVSSLLILLFGVLKKPIAAIVFSVLVVVAFYALRWDFDDRGVLPSSQYGYGIAEYIYPISFVVVVAGAIWFMVSRHIAKTVHQQLANNTTDSAPVANGAAVVEPVAPSKAILHQQQTGAGTFSGSRPSLLSVSHHRHAAKYSTPASKIGWYLSPGTLTYRPLPERSE